MASTASEPRLPFELIARVIDERIRSTPGLGISRGAVLGLMTICQALYEPVRASVYSCWYRELEIDVACTTIDLALRPPVASLAREVEINGRVQDKSATMLAGAVSLGLLATMSNLERLTVTRAIVSVADPACQVLARLSKLRYLSIELDSERWEADMDWAMIVALAQQWPRVRVLQLGLDFGVATVPVTSLELPALTTLRLYNPMCEASGELGRLLAAMPPSLVRVYVARDMQCVPRMVSPTDVIKAIGAVAERLDALEIFEQTYDRHSGMDRHPAQAAPSESHLLINAAALLPRLKVVRSLALVGTTTPASAFKTIPPTVERLHLSCHSQGGNAKVLKLVKSGALPALRCVRARARDSFNCSDGWSEKEYEQLHVRVLSCRR